MPIFEYQCLECSHIFEKFQAFSHSLANPGCPKCQTAQTSRIFSRFSSPSSDVGSMSCIPSALS